MPNPSPHAGAGLTRKDDGLYYKAANLTYRITGLMPYNLDRLRITLKAWKNPLNPNPSPDGRREKTNGGLFHIDTLDLYQSKARIAFSEECSQRLDIKESSAIMDELSGLINVLEQERIRMQEQKGKSTIPTMTEEEKKEALTALKDKNLIRTILDDFNAIGLVGEDHNKLLGYLGAVSRLLADPLGILILSRSGAGKTYLQDAICKFIPEESVIQYTRITGQSLFYRDKNALKNKVLAIEEEEGMTEAIYSIRTLLSSQKLSIASTRADAKTGKLGVDEYTVYGPTVVMLSTTNPDTLDEETKHRFLILTIDESQEQTKKILKMQWYKNSYIWYKNNMDASSITRLHHNMQRLLKSLVPIIPDSLKKEYPFHRLQMRREQEKYISLIKAITLLHQYQRKQGTVKRADGKKLNYVMVEKKDIELALKLGRAALARNVDDVSPTGRTLLEGILAHLIEKYEQIKGRNEDVDLSLHDIPFTRKELRQKLGWGETQVRQNITHLVELGYVGIISGKHGSIYRYVLLDDGTNDPKLEL